jgi:hypothetical protein
MEHTTIMMQEVTFPQQGRHAADRQQAQAHPAFWAGRLTGHGRQQCSECTQRRKGLASKAVHLHCILYMRKQCRTERLGDGLAPGGGAGEGSHVGDPEGM